MSAFPRSPAVLACALAAGLAAAAPAHAEWIYGRLVPDAPTIEPNGVSDAANMSNDGKTVVFTSGANNWIPADPSFTDKAVAIDLDTSLIEIVSRTTAGAIVRGESPSVSRDGRYVAFLNYAQNLDVGVPTGGWQVARKDRVTGELRLASANALGEATTANDDDVVSISGNGRYVAFESASPNLGFAVPDSWPRIFVKDMDTGQVELASPLPDGGVPADPCTLYPHALSDDGRYIAFICDRALVPGAGTKQVYVRDLVQNTTEVISRASGANGQVSTAFAGRLALSPNGRFVTFQNPSYSGLGGDPDTHSGIYIRDRVAQTTTSIPKPAAASTCYASDVSDVATVLMECSVNSSSQVFLHVPGIPAILISTDAGGQPGNGASGYTLAMDASGLSMVFESAAKNIDPDDNNNASDIFVLVDSSIVYGIFRDGFED